MIIEQRIPARVGLIGNPSDGFFGKTIACAISNFAARVTIWESPRVEFKPHQMFDPIQFDSFDELARIATSNGYYGGLRLMFAAAKLFHDYSRREGIALASRNFTVSYDTDIPRQVGLAGSSAIITGVVKGLLRFYGVTEQQIPRPVVPNLILAAERDELGIAAGLQDRVAQSYGGLVYMDFSRELMELQGHGRYEPLDPALLPALYLAYTFDRHDAGISGAVHRPMRYRWEQGEPLVVEGMRHLAELTDEARGYLDRGEVGAFQQAVDRNFAIRREMYGDAALGSHNLKMIEIAHRLGLCASFAGSGGAIVGLCDDDRFPAAQEAFEADGAHCVRLEPHRP